MTRVLVVVEDDQDMQMLIRITLQREPMLKLVGEAATAAEAIELARKSHPDLIVLDHFIHGDIMGLEAAPALKRAAPHAKILLFTSHDLAAEVQNEPAIDGYLRKHDIQQLLPTVRRMLGLDAQPAGAR